MRRSGFVLVGGSSSRMGQDKSLLPFRGETLLDHIARQVLTATGSVTLVGAPERYTGLGYRAIPDHIPGCGPLGGVHAALSETRAEWNLIVACDMPQLDGAFLNTLLSQAEQENCECLVPVSAPGKTEPLCAAWHRTALAEVETALRNGVRCMRDALKLLKTKHWPADPAWFANANTPQEWATHA
ncbi:MAG: molybdenum cofactor guanylyltransferase [Acidobacteriales bacterium]|nr:molybdenum cofactor guanylyltransferase [Terriglobales bacterium]